MKKKLQFLAFYTVAVCFFILGVVNLLASFGEDHLLNTEDPLSHFSYRLVLSFGGLIQLLVSAAILTSSENWIRAIWSMIGSGAFLAYQCWTWSQREPHIFSCIGNLTDWLPLPPRVFNIILEAFYLFAIGASSLVLATIWSDNGFKWREAQFLIKMTNRLDETSPPLDNERGARVKYRSLHRLWILTLAWVLGAGLLTAVVGSFYIRSILALPTHFKEMVHEICSVGDIRFAPLTNPNGTQVLYGRDMEDGVGIFLVDLKTLKREEIRHISSNGPFRFDLFNLFGWSPDGHYLAFSTTTAEGEPNREISICDGLDGKHIRFFTAGESIRRGVWITPSAIALMGRSHKLYLLNVDEQEGSKESDESGLHLLRGARGKESNSDSAYSMARLSEHSFAFVEGNNLFSFNILNDQITQLTFFDKETVIEWPAFDEATGQFLMCLTKGNNQNERYLYQFDSKASSDNALVRLTDSRSYKGQWINEGQGKQSTGVAYVGSHGNENYLAIKTASVNLSTNVFLEGHIRAYGVGPKGDKIYAIASIGAEPMGIWEYDISSGALRNILPGTEKPFINCRVVAPVKGVVASDSGTNINYYYFPPANLDIHKRYPIMIDSPRDSRWDTESQLVANSGIFYVSINQAGLASFDIQSVSPNDIIAVCREMLNNPNVDSNRIYVAGVSWGTQLTSRLVQCNPRLWHGVVLLSPVTLTPMDLRSTRMSSLFVSVGLNDLDEWVKQSEQLEKQACTNLKPAKFIFHKNAAHTMETSQLMMERYGPMAEFILRDY